MNIKSAKPGVFSRVRIVLPAPSLHKSQGRYEVADWHPALLFSRFRQATPEPLQNSRDRYWRKREEPSQDGKANYWWKQEPNQEKLVYANLPFPMHEQAYSSGDSPGVVLLYCDLSPYQVVVCAEGDGKPYPQQDQRDYQGLFHVFPLSFATG